MPSSSPLIDNLNAGTLSYSGCPRIGLYNLPSLTCVYRLILLGWQCQTPPLHHFKMLPTRAPAQLVTPPSSRPRAQVASATKLDTTARFAPHDHDVESGPPFKLTWNP